MVLTNLSRIEQYNQIVEQFGQKGCSTNDYLYAEVESLINDGCLYAYKGVKNAFFFVKQPIGLRVYYYLNDYEERFSFEGMRELVIEILFRDLNGSLPDSVSRDVEYFKSLGFQENLIRDQYSGVFKNLTAAVQNDDVIVRVATSLEDIERACDLFNNTFDALSGDFISETMFQTLLDDKLILIAENVNKEFCGALHFYKIGKTVYLAHVAVASDKRGLHIGKVLFETFLQHNMVDERTRYNLWVQRNNVAAVNMYKSKGFVFTGKSSLSLILN